MCGIIGYIGGREAVPILVAGLKRLEYRGYDSAGVCIRENGKLGVVKRAGRISSLESEPLLTGMRGTAGIAHTRWATHGEPNETNAHPHTDSKGSIAVVHNGIIENHSSLRKMLERKGCIFKSETDSEVIAHLISDNYRGNLEDAVARAVKLIEGAFGMAVMHEGEDKIVAARRSSPLVIGIGDGESFMASDPAAIVEHTKKAIYLDDGEIAVITRNGAEVRRMNGELVSKEIEEIKIGISEIEKGSFSHFMLKEIFEQPEAITNVMRGRLRNGGARLTLNVDVSDVGRIIIVACGTSWHAGLIGKFIIERVCGIPVEVDYASEFRYRDPVLRKDDLVVAISQSGETADTLGAVRKAKSMGLKTVGIINVVGSSISREVMGGIYLHAGPEIGVASTKAFTTQIMALTLLALHIARARGMPVDENIVKEMGLIPEKVRAVLGDAEKIREIAGKYSGRGSFLFLGRGISYPAALEGALKLKEISYIHAEGYPAGEMKHGPIALIDEGFPVVFIAQGGGLYDKALGNMQEVKARKASVIAVSDRADDALHSIADDVISIPKTAYELSPILETIPLQLLAYYIAVGRGLDVDKPRNLAKSVTVE